MRRLQRLEYGPSAGAEIEHCGLRVRRDTDGISDHALNGLVPVDALDQDHIQDQVEQRAVRGLRRQQLSSDGRAQRDHGVCQRRELQVAASGVREDAALDAEQRGPAVV